ncbi:MAG: hypothetical protein WAX66_04085 [Patescibacteria group bacterium]
MLESCKSKKGEVAMPKTASYHSTMKLVPKRIFGRVVWFCIPKGHYIRVAPNDKDEKPDKDEYVYLNDPGTIVKGCPTRLGRVRFNGHFGPVCFFRITTKKSFGFKCKELLILPSVFTKVAWVNGSLCTNSNIKSLFRKPWLKKQQWKLPKEEEKNSLIDRSIGSISKANLREVGSQTLPNYAIVVIAHTDRQYNNHGVFVVF